MKRRLAVISFILGLSIITPSRADIYRWDNGLLIPGTEGVEVRPGAQLDNLDLEYANLRSAELDGADLEDTDLTSADLTNANLGSVTFTGANLAGAVINGAVMNDTTARGLTFAQFASTASYQTKDLQRIWLCNNDFSGWDFSGQNLSGAVIQSTDLTNANLTDATITQLWRTNVTQAQFASTANYKAKDLQGLGFGEEDLSGWDLSGQNMSGVGWYKSVLTGTDFTGSVIAHAGFSFETQFGFTQAQLASTASYQAKDLQGILLDYNDLSGWDFRGQNLANAKIFSGDLFGADFSGADLNGAFIEPSFMSHANLTGANLTNARLTPFEGLETLTLTGAIVTGANLSRFRQGTGINRTQLESTANYQGMDLQGIDFASLDLSDWDFHGQNLSNARFSSATLTNANLTGALVNGTTFVDTTARGFTHGQLESTASYQAKDLQGINLERNDLSGWDFHGQNLSSANLKGSTLKNADLSGALIKGTAFTDATSLSFTQFASTASYQAKDLQGVILWGQDLSGWDLSGQNLTNAFLISSTPGDFDLAGAIVTGAVFLDGRITQAQLASTASYQAKDLKGIYLSGVDLTGWDFSGQNLGNANLIEANLTDADLTGANLKNTVFVPENNLSGGDLGATKFDSRTTYNQWTRFPAAFNPLHEGLTFQPSPIGDFDGNDVLDVADVDLLSTYLSVWLDGVYLNEEFHGRPFSADWLDRTMYDVNHDGRITTADQRVWVQELKQTWFGDANLDGEFNSSDLVIVFQAGEYEDSIDDNSGWAEGDWDCDGDFTSKDIVLAFQDGGYERGPRAAVAFVPEPRSCILIWSAMSGFIVVQRRRPL
jgi:uncharacterized protein YjbI with pentapeptide repeats